MIDITWKFCYYLLQPEDTVTYVNTITLPIKGEDAFISGIALMDCVDGLKVYAKRREQTKKVNESILSSLMLERQLLCVSTISALNIDKWNNFRAYCAVIIVMLQITFISSCYVIITF